MKKKTEYTRMLGPFSGIDVTSDDSAVSSERLPYLVNMWRDWESENGAALETIPGCRRIPWVMNGAKIHNLWAAKFYTRDEVTDFLIIHSGGTLYACPVSERDNADATVYTVGEIADADSNGFSFGEAFYVLDGTDMWKICSLAEENGISFNLTKLGDIEVANGLETSSYIPTTYSDGSEYEQRNMLTNYFYNAYNLHNPEEANWYNGLHLEVISETEKTLRVTGVHYGITHIYIPSEVTWNGELYKITTIGAGVFANNQHIESLVAASGVSNIEAGATSNCPRLKSLILHGVTSIGKIAFLNATALERVVLARTLTSIETAAFSGCPSGTNFYYEGQDESVILALTQALPEGAILKTGVEMIEVSVGDTFRISMDLTVFSKYRILNNVVNEAIEKIETYTEETETGVEFKAKSKTSWIAIAFTNADQTIEKLAVVTVTEDGTAVNSKESTIQSYRFDILDPCAQIVSVVLNGKEVSPEENGAAVPNYSLLAEELNGKQYIRAVVITGEEKTLKGQKLVVKGVAYDSEFSRSRAGSDYTYDNGGYKGTSIDAIKKCTIAAEYDGRIFLTGNPKLPNTVFYSHRNLQGVNDPTYFGHLNYFNDGTGMNPNKSLLATPSYLAVLKADNVGGSAIYYHTPSETEYDITPKIYPGTKGTAGIGSLGPCINFRDDPVFISTMGLEGISLSALNSERGIYHRSSNVDKWLLKHRDLHRAKLCEWKGYLIILVGGEIFMADSRQFVKHPSGSTQYEWYFLNDIGEYVGQTEQYFFPSASPIDENYGKYTDMFYNGIQFEVKNEESLFQGEWKSVTPSFHAEGTTGTTEINIRYAEERDEQGVTHYYILDSYGEKVGGVFSPASALAECAGVLYYGTEAGGLFCFNTDKRGVSYEYDTYIEPVPPDQIHRLWYSRNGRRYLSGFSTKKDNCGAPQYDKDTCRRSLVVKSKTLLGSSCTVKVRTDREPWEEVENHTLTEATFFDNDFQNHSFMTSGEMITISRESKRRWIEKQYYFYSDEWCRPFGIYYLSYRYKISGLAGRIRRE